MNRLWKNNLNKVKLARIIIEKKNSKNTMYCGDCFFFIFLWWLVMPLHYAKYPRTMKCENLLEIFQAIIFYVPRYFNLRALDRMSKTLIATNI